MTLPTSDTIVSYPAGETQNTATVLHVEALSDGRTALLLNSTSCHPVDAGWPDQGADRAVLRARGGAGDGAGGREVKVDECVVAATDGSALFLGSDIPVGKGESGWAFVVAHIVAGDTTLQDGDRVEVIVDAGYRRALSIGHTACHLASLALNAALAGRWTKQARTDDLGNPDFDGLAIESSRIQENGSTDRFRLNKSLRRKGFATEGLAADVEAAQTAVNASLASWSATGSAVRIDRDGDGLTDRRYWTCELAGANVRIPCGGTHATSLAELGVVQVELTIVDAAGTPVLTMETSARPN